MKRIVVLSSDEDANCAFLAPFTAHVWKKITGAEPLVLLIGTKRLWERNPLLSLSYAQLAGNGFRTHFVSPLPPLLTATVAKVARLYAACVVDEPAVLISSDVDAWPIDAAPFAHDGGWHWNVIGSNMYETIRRPMCYNIARLERWLECLGATASDSIEENVLRTLRRICPEAFGGPQTGGGVDETALSEGIREKGFVNLIPRNRNGFTGPALDRIDRDYWPSQLNLAGMIDAHLPRESYWWDNWVKVKALATTLGAYPSWGNEYRERFCKALPT